MPATHARALAPWIVGAGALAIIAIALWPLGPSIVGGLRTIEPHSPDWTLWFQQSPMVQLHVYAAVTALLLGTVILLRPKGRSLHKTLGWAWVFAMAAAAGSSLFIRGLNHGAFSFVHLLSGWTIITLPLAIFAIRNRRVAVHRRAMTGMFVGGLIVAGVLSFLPGRVMFEMFFG